MLDPKVFRDSAALADVAKRLADRGYQLDLAAIQALDARRRQSLTDTENARAAKKKVSASIGQKIREGLSAEAAKAAVQVEIDALDSQIAAGETATADIEQELEQLSLHIPNVPDASVPTGGDASGNVEVRSWGHKPQFSFSPKAHWDIAEALRLLDFEAGTKISGTRFVVYRGLGARLERALAQFMLNTHVADGYEEIIPPYFVTTDSITGTGQLPKFAEDLFHIEGRDLWAIPTAEVPVTNLVKDSLVPHDQLPQRYAAYSPCFRAEAGAAGRDTRGITRQHQFHKVELVHLCRPEQGFDELERMTAQAEKILQLLQLPYRTMLLCTGDMGFGSAKTYDIEVWSPGQDRYVEISSCSLMRDFQARRMRARYKDENGKNQPLYTLNGSGLAVGRTWIAVIENYQQPDGSIIVPEVLRPYMGCDRITAPK